MKRLHTKVFIVLTVFMVPAMEACKTIITNNTEQPYQLREVHSGGKHGKPKTVEPGQQVSFGSSTRRPTFIVAKQTKAGWQDIQQVKQISCGGNKDDKKISIQGILSSNLNGNRDNFEIKKV